MLRLPRWHQAKAGFNLERLDLSFTSKKNAHDWELVFDRVANGEMPPKKKAQPSPEERAAFLEQLGKELRTASLARQEWEGRGPVRRLTRAEYETTVSDLLHIPLDLHALFPDDAVTAGFDKVGEGLTLSATHFAAYQTAAETALNLAILRGAVLNWDNDGAKIFNGRANEFGKFGGWVEGDTMAIASRFFYPYTAISGRKRRAPAAIASPSPRRRGTTAASRCPWRSASRRIDVEARSAGDEPVV